MSGAVFDRKNNGTDWKEIKKEVIPIPACVAILGGKAVLSQYKDESSVSIFLRDVDSGEDSFLFEAEPVLLVTGEGIYYTTVYEENFKFYSFKEICYSFKRNFLIGSCFIKMSFCNLFFICISFLSINIIIST